MCVAASSLGKKRLEKEKEMGPIKGGCINQDDSLWDTQSTGGQYVKMNKMTKYLTAAKYNSYIKY